MQWSSGVCLGHLLLDAVAALVLFLHAVPINAAESSGPALVTNIRYWSTSDYTRVVIDLDKEVRFLRGELSDPHRLYFDLLGAELSDELRGKLFLIGDGLVKQVRVAPNRPNVVRAVLDFSRAADYTVFALYNPYRVVIDVRPGLAAKKAAPPARAKSRSAPEPESERKALAPAAAKLPETPPPGLIRTLGLKIGKIVVDPGHGGTDTGTIGRGGLKEKELVLDIARRLAVMLQERFGAIVVLTRSDDTFVPLEERTAIANAERADLFVSIHANSSANPQVRGVETYFLNFARGAEAREVAARENAPAQRSIHELEDLIKKITMYEKLEESKLLAAHLQKSLFQAAKKVSPGAQDRGVRQAPFIVLIGANMPSVLAEVGFLSNPREERALSKGSARERIAQALCDGIEAYVRSLGGSVALQSN